MHACVESNPHAYLNAVLNANRVTPTARLLIKILESRSRGHAECWSSTSTLVQALRCCERTFYAALRLLEKIGLVRVVRDYSRRARRRILLLWRSAVLPLSEGVEKPPSVTADFAGQSVAKFAVRTPPPPDPPIRKEIEKASEASEQTSPPPRPVTRTPDPPSRPEPDPEAVRQAVERVAKVSAPDPTLPTRVAAVARQWGLDYLLPAVGRLERKATQEPVPSPVGYLIGAMRGFQADGVLPPTVTEPKPDPVCEGPEIPKFVWTPELLAAYHRRKEEDARRMAAWADTPWQPPVRPVAAVPPPDPADPEAVERRRRLREHYAQFPQPAPLSVVTASEVLNRRRFF